MFSGKINQTPQSDIFFATLCISIVRMLTAIMHLHLWQLVIFRRFPRGLQCAQNKSFSDSIPTDILEGIYPWLCTLCSDTMSYYFCLFILSTTWDTYVWLGDWLNEVVSHFERWNYKGDLQRLQNHLRFWHFQTFYNG